MTTQSKPMTADERKFIAEALSAFRKLSVERQTEVNEQLQFMLMQSKGLV